MQNRRLLLLLAFFGAACSSEPAGPPAMTGVTVSTDAIMADIRKLSSDEFEGRAPGTKGETLSVQYFIDQFKAMGLEPGNPDGGWTQKVPLVGISGAPTPLVVKKGATTREFKVRDEVIAFSKHVVDQVKVENSELVFAGYGVQAPEYNWDDFKGVDVKGKTIVVLVNDPPVPDQANPKELDAKVFGGKAMTYYGRWTYKFEKAAELGAAGVLIVHETIPAAYPFSVVQTMGGERFDLVTPDKNAGRAKIEGWMSMEAATALLKMAGQDYQKLKALARTPAFKPVPLGMTASMSVTQKMRTVDSQNVIAKLSGADPTLKNEYVVYTAHWDHFGVGDPVNGDSICNGALDNASGCATVLEIARQLKALKPATKRSFLFLMVTAEEQGLLGSQYYAEFPLYPLDEDARQHQHRRHQPVGTHEGPDGRRPRRVGPRRLRAGRGRRTGPRAEAGRRAREGLLLPLGPLQFRQEGRAGVRSGFGRRLPRQAAGVRQAEARRVHQPRLPRAVRRDKARVGSDGRGGRRAAVPAHGLPHRAGIDIPGVEARQRIQGDPGKSVGQRQSVIEARRQSGIDKRQSTNRALRCHVAPGPAPIRSTRATTTSSGACRCTTTGGCSRC